MRERRGIVPGVDTLEVLLSRQSLIYQKRVVAAESKDENAEENGDKGSKETRPVEFEYLEENI